MRYKIEGDNGISLLQYSYLEKQQENVDHIKQNILACRYIKGDNYCQEACSKGEVIHKV